VFQQFSRDELKKAIEDNGGKEVPFRLKQVMAGDNMGPAKLEKAAKLNIPMLTDFMKLVNENL
jgi:DNA ligase (NAD+)